MEPNLLNLNFKRLEEKPKTARVIILSLWTWKLSRFPNTTIETAKQLNGLLAGSLKPTEDEKPPM